MHGDFSRDSFDPAAAFTRVLQQQGRLVVDADANEQSAILLAVVRNLAADLIGWHGGPGIPPSGATLAGGAFAVAVASGNVSASGGRYYVDGIAVDSPPVKAADVEALNGGVAVGSSPRLAFLDVWERFVAAPADPTLYDPALGGLDTAARVRLEARVATAFLPSSVVPTFAAEDDLRKFTYKMIPAGGGAPVDVPVDTRRTIPVDGDLPLLAAWTVADRDPATPLPTAPPPPPADIKPVPRGGYGGLENQLYRVEVHHGGAVSLDSAGKVSDKPIPTGVTVKWSRDNGSVAYPYTALSRSGGTCQLTLAAAWRDDARAVSHHGWVELLGADDEVGVLLQVSAPPARTPTGTVLTLTAPDGKSAAGLALDDLVTQAAGLLRRWDHQGDDLVDGGIPLLADADKAHSTSTQSAYLPIDLEDGLSVRLAIGHPVAGAVPAWPIPEFRAGDYWLIPARQPTGDVLWGQPGDAKAAWKPARYTAHHYAPLAHVDAAGTGITDLRRPIKPIAG